MEKQKIFDEEFKQNVSAKFRSVKEKVSDALLTEDGKLDTQRIGNAVEDTARKVEEGVKGGYEKFQAEYVKDGELDKEKLGESAKRTYRKAGRSLATGVTRLANFLTDKFGTQSQNGEIVDTEIVTEQEAPVVTAEPEDFVTEE